VLVTHQTSSGTINDYCDGEHFKTHPLFAACPNALQITLYYDDLEICNALGTKAKIHKLSMSMHAEIVDSMHSIMQCDVYKMPEILTKNLQILN